MTPAWAQRRRGIVSDWSVSPDVFHQMVDRLGEFVCPINRRLRPSRATQRPSLPPGAVVSLPGKMPRTCDVRRCATTRSCKNSLARTMGPTGRDQGVGGRSSIGSRTRCIIAFDPSSFPKRGRIRGGQASVVWSPRQSRQCQVGVFMGYVSRSTCLARLSACPCPRSGHGDEHRRKHARATRVRYQNATRAMCVEMLDAWAIRYLTAGSPAMTNWVATRGCVTTCASAVDVSAGDALHHRDTRPEAPLPVYTGRGRRPKPRGNR